LTIADRPSYRVAIVTSTVVKNSLYEDPHSLLTEQMPYNYTHFCDI